MDCSTPVHNNVFLRHHTEDMCLGLRVGYDKTLMNTVIPSEGRLPASNTNWCPRHPNVQKLRGDVCYKCTPNATIYGLTRSQIQKLNGNQKPPFTFLYRLENGHASYKPEVVTSAGNVQECQGN